MALTPSTLMGPGWRARSGDTWTPYGQSDEWSPLRHVLLLAPPDSIGAVRDPNEALFLGLPDLDRMRAQCDAVADAYRRLGVQVTVWQPPADAPPNVVFARDLVWMTPEGAVVCRPAAAQRAGEERYAAQALAAAGIPIRYTVTNGTFEGADALWLGDHVVAGVGRRTTACPPLAPVVEVQVPAGVQHLLGAANIVDRDLAVVHASAGADIRAALGGFTLVEPDPEEGAMGRSMNFVTVGPRELLMPAGCPRSRAIYEARGVTCHEVDVPDYLLAAGALGCITAILRRG